MINNLIMFEDKSLDPAGMGGVQGHGGLGSKEYDLMTIDKLLVGKIVRVYWSQAGHKLNADDAWITSICIKGKLEHKGNWFRVLVENDTYCYFDFDDILTVGVRKERPHSISLKSESNQ